MRIACLTRLTDHHGVFGGMERHLAILAKGLVDAGHQVEIFTTAHPNGKSTVTQDEITTHFLPTPPARYRRSWMVESRRAIKENNHRFDLLWGEGAAAEGVARLALDQRPPLVTILHGTFLGERLTRLQQKPTARLLALAALMRWRQAFWRAHIEKAAGLIAVSQEVKNQVVSFANVTAADVDVVVNGVDQSRFKVDLSQRRTMRQHFGLKDDDTLFVHLSRLEKEKGGHLGIRALQAVGNPSTHLLFIGNGSQVDPLRNLAHDAGIENRIHFAGYVPNEEVPRYLGAADALLLPSLAKEGLPISILEGMAAGLPIVATNVGGIVAAVDHGDTGFLFDRGDVAALTDILTRLSDNPDERRKIGQNARRKVASDFAVAGMIRHTENIFTRVVEQSARWPGSSL